MRTDLLVVLALAALLPSVVAVAQRRPALPPSRYAYSFEVDQDSLPKGVTVTEKRDGDMVRHFIRNTSDRPLVIDKRMQDGRMVGGTKLVDGKVYGYFPSSVPMEGKTHLKGWQAPFGDIEQTTLILPREPETIYKGRTPGLGREVPPDEAYALPVEYDGKPHEIKLTIRYRLDPDYDK